MSSRREVLLTGAAAVAVSLAAGLDPRLAEARAWLRAKSREPGVKAAPKGLFYRVLKSGPADGRRPRKGDKVAVIYEARLAADGKIVDRTPAAGKPDTFTAGALIGAWNVALPLMRPGDQWELYAPPELAYGAAGNPGAVPPYAAMIFTLELVAVG